MRRLDPSNPQRSAASHNDRCGAVNAPAEHCSSRAVCGAHPPWSNPQSSTSPMG